MTVVGGVKREGSAPRGADNMIEEAAKEYENFEQFWRACVNMIETEADVTETIEEIAELKGWSGQLNKMRRAMTGSRH